MTQETQQNLDVFKQTVIENCKNPSFRFKDWFAKDHLMIVEKIAMELCDIYTNADRDAVFALVWLHDFGKPIDEKRKEKLLEQKVLRL